MAYSTVVDATIITTVDCQKQVRSWRLLRSLVELLVPTCNCTFVNIDKHEIEQDQDFFLPRNYNSPKPVLLPYNNNTITGTIFGSPKGKVYFCIQANPKSASPPALLLELAIPTTTLAKEMRSGHLRIALVANANGGNGFDYNNNSCSLLSTPLWTMYCNGRKVGFAIRRHASKSDTLVLRHMEPVVVGAGIISRNELEHDDEIMYLRGNFKRVHGSSTNSETFHLIDPEGNVGQELSIFFLRSR